MHRNIFALKIRKVRIAIWTIFALFVGMFLMLFGTAFETSLVITLLLTFSEFAIEALVSLSKQENDITSIRTIVEEITDGERIIKTSQEKAYILDASNSNPAPPPVRKPTRGKWNRSISILRYSALQDLIFSPKYLGHFFGLPSRADHTQRILVINEKLRHPLAATAYCMISRHLEIDTYLMRSKVDPWVKTKTHLV